MAKQIFTDISKPGSINIDYLYSFTTCREINYLPPFLSLLFKGGVIVGMKFGVWCVTPMAIFVSLLSKLLVGRDFFRGMVSFSFYVV